MGAELKEQKEGVFVLLKVEIGVKRTKRVGFCAFDLNLYGKKSNISGIIRSLYSRSPENIEKSIDNV